MMRVRRGESRFHLSFSLPKPLRYDLNTVKVFSTDLVGFRESKISMIVRNDRCLIWHNSYNEK